jgi:hypothetical protein
MSIDFVQEHSRQDRFTNLERVVDDKLQLELVPYGSAAFSARGFTPAALAPEGGYMWAGLAQSWARQGMHMAAVAEEIRSRYEDAAQ